MQWIESIERAIAYIEENINEDLTIEDIANKVFISPFYFQKGFTMLCSYTISEYIRCRRLALAGSELISTNHKIIDIAIKYGYNSPDSFTKSFIRFHGVSPTAVRKSGALIKAFAPLKINFKLEGGDIMNYKIENKEAFTVIGVSKTFKYDNAMVEVSKFCMEHHKSDKNNIICGMYGINIDESMEGNQFEYMIADDYIENSEVPEGFVKKVIPKFTWAIFPCIGPMPESIQKTSEQIFSQWLPNCKEYQIAAGYNIEMYEDPTKYKKGLQDEKYYSEIWIPVKQK